MIDAVAIADAALNGIPDKIVELVGIDLTIQHFVQDMTERILIEIPAVQQFQDLGCP